MKFSRRIFMRRAPVAVAAAPIAISSIASPQQVAEKVAMDAGSPVPQWAADVATPRPPRPPRLDDYYKAMSKRNDAFKYRALMHDCNRILQHDGSNPNIDALRSVSRQHKLHMYVQMNIRRREEDQTFMEKMQDFFGVRDWFRLRDADIRAEMPATINNL